MNATQQARSNALIRVLLVDGDPYDHRLISDLLDSVPFVRFTIDWVKNLAEGLDRLKDARYDVCLLDHQLPDGDGLDLLASADVLGLALPMVVLTESAPLESDQRALMLGAAAFLDKDKLDPMMLERIIRYVIHQRKISEGLARRVFFDESTGLISRTLYRERLDRALAFARRRDREVAVMLIDLAFDPEWDQGKNLTNALIAESGRRLFGDLRETDSIARLSDRRIALLIEGIRNLDQAATVARKALRLLRTAIDVDGQAATLVPSIGVAIYPREGSEGQALMRQAEAAMRRAITDGGGCCRFASERVDAEAREGMVLEKAFGIAFERRELRLCFYPELHLTRRLTCLAAEVLWRHPDRGWLPTNRALADTDDVLLIKGIADWFLASAAEQFLAWRRDGLAPHRLALTIPFRRRPALSLLHQATLEQVQARQVDPARFELELQEELVLDDTRRGCSDLIDLRTTGMRLALDDFGQGRAAVQDLRHDLLHGLKLGPDLSQDQKDDERQKTLLRALIALGKGFELDVTAKGTRDRRQFAFLKHLGCDAIQLSAGFPAMGAETTTAWLKAMAEKPKLKSGRQLAPSPEILVPDKSFQRQEQTQTPTRQN